MGGESDDNAVRLRPLYLARGLKAIHDGHIDVHEHHGRVKLQSHLHSFRPCLGLTNHGEAFMALKESPEALAHRRIVIGN